MKPEYGAPTAAAAAATIGAIALIPLPVTVTGRATMAIAGVLAAPAFSIGLAGAVRDLSNADRRPAGGVPGALALGGASLGALYAVERAALRLAPHPRAWARAGWASAAAGLGILCTHRLALATARAIAD